MGPQDSDLPFLTDDYFLLMHLYRGPKGTSIENISPCTPYSVQSGAVISEGQKTFLLHIPVDNFFWNKLEKSPRKVDHHTINVHFLHQAEFLQDRTLKFTGTLNLALEKSSLKKMRRKILA